MIRTQIQFDEEQIKWLRKRARERQVSVSQLVREGVHRLREQNESIPEERKRRALAAVGRFSSGLSDVSKRHDEYLAEAYGSGGSDGQ